jgi:hypothetical protein
LAGAKNKAMAKSSSDFVPSVRTHRAEPRPDEKRVRMDGTIFVRWSPNTRTIPISFLKIQTTPSILSG